MKFLTNSDLYLILSEKLIHQALCDSKNIDLDLNRAEDKAIEEVKQWLSQRYDLDYELRPYSLFEVNKVYSNDNRLLLTASTENKKFADEHGLNIIFSGRNDQMVVLKNSCELLYNTEYASQKSYSLISYSNHSTDFNPNLSFQKENSNYNSSCGILKYAKTKSGNLISEVDYQIWLTGGTISEEIEYIDFNFGSKYNLYNTVWTQTATGSTYDITADTYSQIYTSTTLDYNYQSLVSGLTPSNFQNVSYFDEYVNIDYFIEDDRNATLIEIIASLTIYNLIRRVSPRLMSETISDSFDLALENLKLFNKGTKQINLKRKVESVQKQNGGSMIWGINTTTNDNQY